MKKLIVFTFMSILIFSCKQEVVENEFSSCCSEPEKNITVGVGKVFISNLYTPDYNGVNDLFVIYTNSDIKKLNHLEIKDKNGNLLYSNDTNSTNVMVWNSKKGTEFWYGKLSYKFQAEDKNGLTNWIEGTACSYSCKLDSLYKSTFDKNNCVTPSQFDGVQFDKAISNGEDCF